MSRVVAVFSITLIFCNMAAASDAANGSTAENLFTPEKLKQDLDFLFKTIEEVHPNMYIYTTREEFNKYRESLYKKTAHPMNRVDFYKIVAPTVASLKNGHTFVFPLVEDFAEYVKEGGKVLPISLDWDGENAILARNYSSQILPLGGEILTINGKNASQVIRKLARYFPADGKDSFPWQLERDMLLRPCFWLEYGTADSVDIRIRTIDGTLSDYTVQLMTWEEIEKAEVPNKGKNSYRYVPEDDTYVIELNDWSTIDGIKVFCDEAFKDVHARKMSNLIVDIRNNPGGDSKCAKVFIEYLTDKPYQLFEEVRFKVSKQFCERFSVRTPEEMIGTIYVKKVPLTHPKPNPLRFKGQIFLLVGVRSTSTSLAFAATMKHFEVGTLVGEEPAEHMTSYGNAFEFKLPNSGLRCFSACQVYVLPGSNNDGRGVIPHYEVKQRPEDTARDIDTALQFTLDLIKKSRAKDK